MKEHPLSDLDTDIRDHIEQETEDNIARGLPADEARYAALRKFGNVTRIKEDARAVWIAVWLDQLVQDLRYSARTMRRQPGFAIVTILTLALGIGATTAVFSVVDKVLVQPLPIDHPDRVVVIWPRERANPTTVAEISHATFRSWQQRTKSFQTLAALGSVNWSLILQGRSEPTTIPIAAVSASFFPLVATPAALGRPLIPADDQRGAARVVVMSHACWVRRFGADPTIVGRQLTLSNTTYTVVGVMPDGFDYPRGAELWVPVLPSLADASAKWGFDTLENPWFGVLFVLGRLNSDVTMDAASAEISFLLDRDAGNGFRPGLEPVLTPLPEHIFGKTRPALLGLAASVVLLLLVACANVAALLLARAAGRSHETAIRFAIGATRSRIVRQSFTLTLILSVLGGLVALVLARWTVSALVAIAPADVPRLDAIRFDGRTLVFAWLACVATAALAGIGPGLLASRWNLTDVLKTGNARLTRSRRLQRAFVVVQIALALTLLIGAGLVARSLVNLMYLDIGFDAKNVLTLDVTLPDAAEERRTAFYTELLQRVRSMPGVEAAGAVFLRPLEHAGIGNDGTILIEGQRTDLQYRDWEKNPLTNYEAVTPDYFRALGMRVLRGREFTEGDTDHAQQVVIVSAGLAQRLWPGQNPLGKRLMRPDARTDAQRRPLWSTVVGVVQDARYRGLADLRFDLYAPYLQKPNDPVKHLMVRTTTDPLSLAAPIRTAARRIEPIALVEGVTTMDQVVAGAIAPWRFSATTLGILSALALVVAALGLYGIMSQYAIERTSEIALRIALGAIRRDIVYLVLREALMITMIGIACGLAAATGVGRVLAGLLFGVEPIDPTTLVAMPALFIAVAVCATLVPVWRATKVDPVVGLRCE